MRWTRIIKGDPGYRETVASRHGLASKIVIGCLVAILAVTLLPLLVEFGWMSIRALIGR